MKLSKEVKVGLLATTALTIVYLGSNFLKGKEIFFTGNIYYTTYDNTGGLTTTSPVLVKGLPIGRVQKIEVVPGKNYSVLVAFGTEKNIKLTDATRAKLVSPSLLGGKAIELLIEEGNPLKNHDTVPGYVEQSFGEEFAQTALPALNDAKDASLLASKFITNLVENIDKINAIFTNLEGVTQKLKQTITENEKGFSVLSQNLTEVSVAVSDHENGMGALLKKLNRLIDGAEGIEVKEAADKLNSILNHIEKILHETDKGKNSFSRLLEDDSLYKSLDQTLSNLDNLLVDLKARPWRYVSFSVFGKPKNQESAEEQ